MAHMPSIGGDGTSCGGSGCLSSRIVEYTGVGDESPSGFTIPFGVTLSSADYSIGFFSCETDGAAVPWAWIVKTKQTTECLVAFAGDGPLTVGAVYKFQIVEAS